MPSLPLAVFNEKALRTTFFCCFDKRGFAHVQTGQRLFLQ